MRPLLLTVLSLLLTLQVFVVTCDAAEQSKKKVSQSKLPAVGHCCVEGELLRANQKNCLARKGIFFVSPEKARIQCKKPPAGKSNVPLSLPVIEPTSQKRIEAKKVLLRQPGYCCDEGLVDKLFEEECRERKGSFFSSQAIAKRTCDNMIGYCCVDGEVRKVKNKSCSRLDGLFFTNPVEAKKICDGIRGYCCVDGNIMPTIKRSCKQRGGDFSVNRIEADKACRDNSGTGIAKGPDLGRQGGKTIHASRQVLKVESKTAGKGMKLSASRFTPTPPDGLPETIPFGTEWGITIINPAGSERFYQGESIYVVAQILSEDFSAGMIHFTVMNEVPIVVGTASVAAAPMVSVSLPLRDDAPPGNYFITATLDPDKYGSSDMFSIHRNTARIDFLSPERTSTVHPGDSLDVSYKLNARVEPGPITFDLYHSGTIVQSQMVDYNPGPPIRPGRDSVYHLIWEMSPDLRTDTRYTFMARHSQASGFSQPFTITDPIGFGEGDGTAVYHDLALGDVSIDPRDKTLTAIVENNGDAVDAEVEFDVGLIIFGGSRTIQKHLNIGEGERQEVVLYRFNQETLNRYRNECGLPLSVNLRVPNWQRGIPDSDSYNNQLEKILYLPGGGVRITSSRLVLRRDGFGGGGTVDDGGRIDWTRDFSIEQRDPNETSTLSTSLTIKNCGARPFEYENPVIRATAHGTWPCGGGRLGDCEQDQRLWGPIPYDTGLEPGEETGIDIFLAGLRHVNQTVRIRASANGSSDEFQFFLGGLD